MAQTAGSVLALTAALLFLLAAFSKFRSMEDFRRALLGYRLLPETWVPSASWGIVAAEVVVGSAIVTGQRAALLAAQMLLVTYAVAMAVNLLRGRAHIDCGCGGAAQPLSWWLVGRNLVLTGAFAFAKPPSVATAWDGVTVIGGCFAAGFAYAAFNQLIRNSADLAGWR